MTKIKDNSKRRPRGRPLGDNYSKLNFYVFFAQLRAYMTASLGKRPTDTAVYQEMIRQGGYQPLVVADGLALKAAQALPKADKSILGLRHNGLAYRTKAVIHLTTLRNFCGLAKKLAKTDPTFESFAQAIMAGKALPRDVSEYCVTWRPPLRILGWN